MPTQAYFEIDGKGDWYAALTTVSPGESPAIAPEKWYKMAILDVFEEYLVDHAVALLLQGDGQSDKRRLSARDAESLLDDVVWRHAPRRGDFNTAEVLVR